MLWSPQVDAVGTQAVAGGGRGIRGGRISGISLTMKKPIIRKGGE